MIPLRGTNDMSDCKHGEYKPQKGTWTLTAPDGRQWLAESGLLAAAKEQNERIPPEVRLARILEPLEPDEGEEAVDETAHILYMCKTDFDYELGQVFEGTKIYRSVKALEYDRPCVSECGVVMVKVTLLQIVKEANFENTIQDAP